ncbi:EF-hand calcium-binding domain-containing protein 8 [Petaurus breviceps papuanus]|uniref:EF-hand calcium-binding domain-containing protein 8 n=1 Tax=Petaurus breviceps papuanus TaxID=3040969 RepID=UPI0036DB099A
MKNPKKGPHIARSCKTSRDEKSRKPISSHKSLTSDGPKKVRAKSETTTTSQSICSQPNTEECVNQEILETLEKMFEKTADHTGALNMEGFQKVMKETFSSVTDEVVESLFWKVDADCDGLVTWRKYLDHLMREFQGKEEMRKDQYRLRLQPPMRIVPLNHGYEIVKLQFLASQFKGSTGRFLTVTKDGILQFWDESFKLLRTVHLDQTHRRHTQQMWVNDMVCLGNINLMAIASTDQDLEFFDISGNKCQRTFIFIELDSCALVMDYWTDQHKAVFCIGDTKGNVLIFVSYDIAESGLFHPYIFQTRAKVDLGKPGPGYCSGEEECYEAHIGFTIKSNLINQLVWLQKGVNDRFMTMELLLARKHHTTIINVYALTMTIPDEVKGLETLIISVLKEGGPYIKISMQQLLTKKSKIHRSYRLKAIHTNWCQQIKFIPQLNLVASCSAIDNTAMVLTIVPTRTDHLKTSTMTLRKGVLCFDYCPDRNFLVTGGYDPIILLWNPLFIKKPMWRMKGHQTSVTHVIVNGKSSCIISISKDKNVRLWDIHNFLCFQSFSGKFFALGNHPITSVYFHKANDTFICGTYSIGILSGYLEAQVGSRKIEEESTTHHTTVCGVLYSKTFRQVVSGSLNGVVCVWELVTGKKVMEFAATESKDVELTAMVLDELERCLITGMRNGAVKMWNYNIGICLLHFPNPDQMEISGIAHMNGVFYVAGWSKRISWFLYRNKEVVPLYDHWPYFHTEDILCLAKYHRNILGSASYNGDIFIWNVSWGKPLVYFNASRSPLVLKPRKVFMEENRMTLADLVNRTNRIKKYWAKKALRQPTRGQSAKYQVNRNLTSAPSAMKHTGGKEPPAQGAPLSLQKPRDPVSSKAVNLVRPQNKTWIQSRNLLKENEDYARHKEKKDSVASVEKIIFLPTRLRTPRTATLLSSAGNGYIYAWSIHDKGGLLGKFQPAGNQYQDSVVGAMVSDEKDWILITGDSKGYVKVWDIKDYCRLASEQKTFPVWEEKRVQENIYRNLTRTESRVEIQQEPLETEEVIGSHVISLIPPELLISWQAHDEGVTDVAFGECYHVIISAGADFNVKAWKISGEAIGTFGLCLWRRLVPVEKIDSYQKSSLTELMEVPTIKKVPESDKEDEYTRVLMQQRRDQMELMSLLHSESPEAMARLRQLAEQSILGSVKAGEGVEDTWNKWKTSGMLKSDIVGKAYKPKERQRAPETATIPLKFVTDKEISPWVYRSLPCKDLQDLIRSNMAILKTAQTPRKKHVWLVTQQMIKSLSQVRQMSIDTPVQSQSLSFSSPVSSKTSSVTSVSSLKLSSISSLSSLKQSSLSSASALSKKVPHSSSVSSKKKATSNTSSSTATKSSITISSVPSVKSSTPLLKPLKSILKG